MDLKDAEPLLMDSPRCADCTSFPISFRRQERFCRSAMDTVSFMTPACDRQNDRTREPSEALERMKIEAMHEQLALASRRLDDGINMAYERNARREAEMFRAGALDDFLKGKSDQLLSLDMSDVVYFVRCHEFVKIGFTSTPIGRRMRGMMCGNPYEITLIGFVPGSMSLERRFHRHLREHHHRGEWFRSDERFIRRIRSLIANNGGRFFGDRTEAGK